MRVEFKSKAILHFDQDKPPFACASLAYNGAVHTVAINALTVADVIYVHLLAEGLHCPSPIRIVIYANSAITISAMVCMSFAPGLPC